MTVTSDQLLIAIESDELEARAITDNDASVILILIDGKEVLRVGCLHLLDRPGAKVTLDGRSVEVFPSHGLPQGLSIGCKTHEEASLIADALDRCFESAYLDLMDESP